MRSVELHGRAIAITGASSGIGRATAIVCAHNGMNVVLAARREDRLLEVVEQIRGAGGKAEALAMDVNAPGENQRLIDFTASKFGAVFAVFSNAGYGIERQVLQYTNAELEQIFRTNFWSSLELMKLSAAHMLAKNSGPVKGHILACSSCVSKIGLPNFAAYSGTKSLQDHFGRAMRAELDAQGVCVSTVHPIGTRTEFFENVSTLSGGKRASIQTPDSFKQSPDVVAKAIVKRLRKPQGGEVWTSFPVRFGLAVSVLMPGLTDWMLRRRQRDLPVPPA